MRGDKPHGRGVYTVGTGAQFVGWFKNGKPGKGVPMAKILPDGQIYYGKFNGWKKSDKRAVEIFPDSTPLHPKTFKRFTGSFAENYALKGTALM